MMPHQTRNAMNNLRHSPSIFFECQPGNGNAPDISGEGEPELIWNLQSADESLDCYATADTGECDQAECIWREDCVIDPTICGKAETCHATLAARFLHGIFQLAD